jgi:nucleolar protein 14
MGRQQPKRKASKNKKKWKDYGEESGKNKPKVKDNPFEVRKQKLKKEVLNSNVRGNVMAPVKSRSLAETKRNESLGVEFMNRNKQNTFIDRRFHGIDPNLSAEDQKYILFQKQRQKEFDTMELGEEVPLTHRGQVIDFDKQKDFDFNFNEQESSEGEGFGEGEGEGEGDMDTERTHRGKKSEREIYAEMIKKSKIARNEAQKERSLIREGTTELDAEFDSISDLLSKYIKRDTRQNEIDEMIKRMNEAQANQAPLEEQLGIRAAEADDFDRMAREMTGEARAQASDPLQTPEDFALAEKKRLQQLEEQRIRRMHASDGDELPKKQHGADDLDDGFLLDDGNYKKKKKDKKSKKER